MPPEFTPNLNLAKPDLDDQYNVAIWNANSDKIDEFAGLVPPRALTADKLRTGANINGVLFTGETDVVTGWGWYYPTVNYSMNNVVFTVIGNEVKVKRSLQNNNIGHSLSDINWWMDVEIGGGTSPSPSSLILEDIGTVKFSLAPLNSDRLHILNGETITDIPIDFLDYINWLKSKAPNCFVDSETYNSQLSLYGECGHFVYDSTYGTIRLPKITGIIQGTNTLSALGNIIQAGLPSHSHSSSITSSGIHTHTISMSSSGAHTHTRGTMNITGSFGRVEDATASGAFSTGTTAKSAGMGSGDDQAVIDFNAANTWTGSTSSAGNHSHSLSITDSGSHNHSLSIGSAVYSGNVGNTNTVQPQTVQGFYYMVYTNLGTSQDSFIQIIENKADKSYVDNQMAIADQTYATKAELAAIPQWRYVVVQSLPETGETRVIYLIERIGSLRDTHDEYIWIEETESYEYLGSTQVDLSNYYTKAQVYNKSEIDTKLLEIQTGDVDVSQQISSVVDSKFIEGAGIDFTNNLRTTTTVTCDNENLVVTSSYTGIRPQAGKETFEFIYDGTDWLINEQVADLNIYYLTVTGTPEAGDKINLEYNTITTTTISTEFDGNYNNLTNKPTIPDPQIQADWNQTNSESADFIKNKPVIPNAQIQSDWNQTDSDSADFIKNKPIIPAGVVVDQIYDSQSTDAQSGVAVSQAISTKEDKNIAINVLPTSGSITLTDNSVNALNASDSITFVLPSISDDSTFHQILIQLKMTSPVSLTLGTSNIIGNLPDLSSGGIFNIIYEYRKDLNDWSVGVIAITN